MEAWALTVGAGVRASFTAEVPDIMSSPGTLPPPSFSQSAAVFARIGILSFGGPAAQIALMQRELVDQRGWLDQGDFLRALSFCMFLPGPEAMQLVTYAGWRLHGTLGGVMAGGLFVAPGALVVLGLSVVYAALGQVPLVAALFLGVQASVVVIIADALWRMARRALISAQARLLAGLAFTALFLMQVPFPAVIGCAALAGVVFGRGRVARAVFGAALPRFPWQSLFGWGAMWLVPLAGLWLFEGGILAKIGSFFARLAVVTFGGAYAVLAFMAQRAVTDLGWLSTAAMMDGLGLAETTPGPLILVTEFVGYMAAHGVGGWTLGLAGAGVALWMTFIPCFLWIFVGAPYLDFISTRPALSAALQAISAAVVGVIANLSLWFALHVIFTTLHSVTFGPLHLIWPEWGSLRPVTVGVMAVAAITLFWRRWPLAYVLGLCAGLSALIAANGSV